uniref:Uncharacterized protein n=1 Tax=Babesia bovis TaxID=5865 RepID=S6B402_BABBO|nr:hypothetical protein [Babesia bovis]BAN65088.1 hypothetical protein [Babesia bovis]BAN66223.1 hypothetical protein [Babesia bovis]
MRAIGLPMGLCYSAGIAIMHNSWSLFVFVLFVKYYDVNCMIIGDNVGNSLLPKRTSSIRHCSLAFVASFR